MTSTYWRAFVEKASKWPNFHETPKLKDMLHGNSLSHYNIPCLQAMCLARVLPTSGRKDDLIERLEVYRATVEENPEFIAPAEQRDDGQDESAVNGSLDAPDNLIIFGEMDDPPAGEDEVEDLAPAEAEGLYEIEKFVRYIEDTDEMEVKWRGYSRRHNTNESCSKLKVDLGAR